MKTKKKTPKAVTLLTKIEALLFDVFKECSEIERSVEKNVRALLSSAETSIAAAKDYFIAPELSKVRSIVKRPARIPRHRVARSRAKARVTAKKRSIGPVARKVAV